MSFKPSVYQQAIFEHISNSKDNAVIEAVAGSGKTTTLIEGMKISNEQDLIFLAFNKHIVNEMKSRLPENYKISTMHSFGLSQITKFYGKNIKVDFEKVKKIIKRNINYLNIKWLKKPDALEYLNNITLMMDLLRMNLCDEKDYNRALEIAKKFSIYAPDINSFITDCLMIFKKVKIDRESIDFTDMIYIPSTEDLDIKRFPLVLVDECQDLSTAQVQLMKKMVSDNGRFIAVGDRRQAIYGFSGADSESFLKLCNIENTKILPLSVCYRCSKKVVLHAKPIVPNIEYFENSPEGSIDYDGKLSKVQSGDFVLSRTNSELLTFAIDLYKNDKIPIMSDMSVKDTILNRIRSTGKDNIRDMLNDINHRIYESKKEDSIIPKKEIDILESVVKLSIDEKTISDVEKKIDLLFSQNGNIHLLTSHKSKGLENKNVHILNPTKFESMKGLSNWEAEQEENLKYVAITRAKVNLSYIKH